MGKISKSKFQRLKSIKPEVCNLKSTFNASETCKPAILAGSIPKTGISSTGVCGSVSDKHERHGVLLGIIANTIPWVECTPA